MDSYSQNTEKYLAHFPLFDTFFYRVDVLVSELNFGAASRWVDAAKRVPVPSRQSSEKETPHTQRDSNSDFHPL